MKSAKEWAEKIGPVPLSPRAEQEIARLEEIVADIQAEPLAELGELRALVAREATYSHWAQIAGSAALSKVLKWMDEAKLGQLAAPMQQARLSDQAARERGDSLRAIVSDAIGRARTASDGNDGAAAIQHLQIADMAARLLASAGVRIK